VMSDGLQYSVMCLNLHCIWQVIDRWAVNWYQSNGKEFCIKSYVSRSIFCAISSLCLKIFPVNLMWPSHRTTICGQTSICSILVLRFLEFIV
jgi:hypothetical protein